MNKTKATTRSVKPGEFAPAAQADDAPQDSAPPSTRVAPAAASGKAVNPRKSSAASSAASAARKSAKAAPARNSSSTPAPASSAAAAPSMTKARSFDASSSATVPSTSLSASPPRAASPSLRLGDDDRPSAAERQPRKIDPKLANAWKTKSPQELSDEEVLAMPDSEYMGEQQLSFFRIKLEALKNDLLSNAGETTEHLREDTSIVPDPADRATIEEEHALELRTRDRERKLLKKITQAIARIDGGEYGFCDETGEPIGLGRLIARPTATLTLEAQQRRELKQKMYGD